MPCFGTCGPWPEMELITVDHQNWPTAMFRVNLYLQWTPLLLSSHLLYGPSSDFSITLVISLCVRSSSRLPLLSWSRTPKFRREILSITLRFLSLYPDIIMTSHDELRWPSQYPRILIKDSISTLATWQKSQWQYGLWENCTTAVVLVAYIFSTIDSHIP